MQLLPVEGSSCVAAVAFESGLIRILWKGGRWSDFPDRSPEDFDALLASPSKGRFIRERLTGGAARADLPDQPRTPLDTFEHDQCCSKVLVRAMLATNFADLGTWSCPKCGCEWKPDPARPPLGRHWRPKPWVAVF